MSPFLAISCAVGQKIADIFTHLPCVNVERGTSAEKAIILICARLGGGSKEGWGLRLWRQIKQQSSSRHVAAVSM